MSTGPDGEDEQPEEDVQRAVDTVDETKQQAGADAEEDEWRFSVDEFPDTADGTEPEGEREGNIAGTLESRQPLEPGDIDLENAFFVGLGILIVVGLIVGAMLGL